MARRTDRKLVEKLRAWFSGVCWLGMRLGLRHAVENDDAVAQMNVVAGNADQALDQKQIGVRRGLRKTTMSPRLGSR